MNMSRFFDLLTSIVVVALVTTLVLPRRETPNVIGAFATGFADILKAAIGPT